LHVGHGVFFPVKRELKSSYAKKELAKNPDKINLLMLLEEEATTEVTSATHGMCRQQILIQCPEFLTIVKELNPDKYEYYKERKERQMNKPV